mgnify:FL=1
MNKVILKSLKKGDIFRRKPDGVEYIRDHYNRKDMFGPASYCCTDWHDIGRSIQLKPSTLVWVGFEF